MLANKKMKKCLSGIVLSIVAFIGCIMIASGNKSSVYVQALETSDITSIFAVGEYKTCDNAHTIDVEDDGTILFDNTYTLTASGSEGAYTLTGKLGTSNTSVNFVQLNNHALICVSHIKYTIDETSYIIYQNTPFLMNYTPVENENGGIEVWSNNVKSATFDNFQSAFMSASNGDTIKLTKNMLISEGTTLMDKNVTIDGGNFTLDKSAWANTIFAVADDATLTLNNLTIDGKATGWEVDFDAVTFTSNYVIPLKSGSADSDSKTEYPAITTSGKLIADNLNISNIYSSNLTYGSTLAISKGEVEISNSEFNHNSAKNGGAILIGYSLLEDSLNEYPVTKVNFIDTDFKNNYANAGSAGAIYVSGAKEITLDNCEFDTNACNTGNGGAIIIERVGKGSGYNSKAHKLGLTFTKLKINNSLFNNNWAGNDGFAIENNDGEIEVRNTEFIGNVGVHFGGSSVGTLSFMTSRSGYFAEQIIDNCLFKSNRGPVSCIGDHGSKVKLSIVNTTFEENEGSEALLLITGVTNIDDCNFVNDKSTVASIYIQPNDEASWYVGSGEETATVVLKDTLFSGSNTTTNIRVCSENHSDTSYVEAELYIEGETNANIQLRDESHLILNGKLTGDVTLDEKTPTDNVVLGENSEMDGNITTAVSKYNVTFNYLDDNNESQSKKIALEINREYSNEEIQELLEISKDGYVFKVYTNNTYTAEWGYTITKAITLYGRWEEHTHSFDTYIANGSSIEKICECGKVGGSLAISTNSNLVYTGTAKNVIITNTLDAQEVEYTITYLTKLENDIWVKTTSPINVGTYKAVLNYQNVSVELLFNIEKATYDLSNLTLSNVEFTYDGTAKTLSVVGLFDGITVTYLNNVQTEVGTYLVTAKFTVDSENYNEIDDMCAILTINEPAKESTDEDTKEPDEENEINFIHCGISAGAGALATLIICLIVVAIVKKVRGY